jgi:hypothetical protein
VWEEQPSSYAAGNLKYFSNRTDFAVSAASAPIREMMGACWWNNNQKKNSTTDWISIDYRKEITVDPQPVSYLFIVNLNFFSWHHKNYSPRWIDHPVRHFSIMIMITVWTEFFTATYIWPFFFQCKMQKKRVPDVGATSQLSIWRHLCLGIGFKMLLRYQGFLTLVISWNCW